MPDGQKRMFVPKPDVSGLSRSEYNRTRQSRRGSVAVGPHKNQFSPPAAGPLTELDARHARPDDATASVSLREALQAQAPSVDWRTRCLLGSCGVHRVGLSGRLLSRVAPRSENDSTGFLRVPGGQWWANSMPSSSRPGLGLRRLHVVGTCLARLLGESLGPLGAKGHGPCPPDLHLKCSSPLTFPVTLRGPGQDLWNALPEIPGQWSCRWYT